MTTRCQFCRLSRYSIEVYVTGDKEVEKAIIYGQMIRRKLFDDFYDPDLMSATKHISLKSKMAVTCVSKVTCVEV